jgi:hypothetical protein
MTGITGTLREDQCTFMIMRYVEDKSCRENQNAHFVCNTFFPRKPCRLWDNVEKYDRIGQATDDNIILLMRIALRITTSTDTLRIFDTQCFWAATLVTRISETEMPAPAKKGGGGRCVAVGLSLMPENDEAWGSLGPDLRGGRLLFGIRYVRLLCHRLCIGYEIFWSWV